MIKCSKTSYLDFLNTRLKTKSIDYVLNCIPVKEAQLLDQDSLPKEYQGIDYIVSVTRLSEEKQIPEMIEAYVKSNINAKFSMTFSIHESAPRTIPESLACGTPVIMGNQGGCF